MRVSTLRKKLSPWIRKAKPELVIVFGSTVTGLPGPESDLDLAILFGRDIDFLGVISDVSRQLHRDDVDLMFLDHAEPIARMSACQGELIYEREKGLFDRFRSLSARQFMDNERFNGIRRELVDEFLHEGGAT